MTKNAHLVKKWPYTDIPRCNCGLDSKTWERIITNTRINCERKALGLASLARELTSGEKTFLAVAWCCHNLPHPPVYYMPEEQAFELADSLGVPRDWLDRPRQD